MTQPVRIFVNKHHAASAEPPYVASSLVAFHGAKVRLEHATGGPIKGACSILVFPR
jgi:hypothetical protein